MEVAGLESEQKELTKKSLFTFKICLLIFKQNSKSIQIAIKIIKFNIAKCFVTFYHLSHLFM
jgi:hypoxanthine-guanine phosphoribosyltransferase